MVVMPAWTCSSLAVAETIAEKKNSPEPASMVSRSGKLENTRVRVSSSWSVW